MNNKNAGSAFERDFCLMLAERGFWVHNLVPNTSGQPADIIAVKNGRAFLIDCKVCTKSKFDTRRVEENQDAAMRLWRDCGNGIGWFALNLDGDIRMISHDSLSCIRRCYDIHVLDHNALIERSLPFDMWVKEYTS